MDDGKREKAGALSPLLSSSLASSLSPSHRSPRTFISPSPVSPELSRLILEGAVCAVPNSDQHLISPYCSTVYWINHNDWKNKWIDYKRGKCLELYTHYFQQYHTNRAENTVENRNIDNSTFKKRIRWILCNFHYILVMSKLGIPYNSVFQTLMSL